MKRFTPLIAAAAIIFAAAPVSAKVRYEVVLTPQGLVAHVGNCNGQMMPPPPPPPPPAPCCHHYGKPTKQQQKIYKKQMKEYKKYVKKQQKLAKEYAKHNPHR